MPMYEYVCAKCGKDFEVRLSMAESDTTKPPCPACGSRSAERRLSAANFSMGGGGSSGGGSDFSSDGPSCSGGSCCCN